MTSKYGNQKYQVDNRLFDSKKEAERYCELKMLLKAGEIKELELQKPFELIPTRSYSGGTVRGCKYIADFYYYDGKLKSYVAEDTKGFATESYKIKKKIFLEKYVANGDLVFFENGKKQIYYGRCKKI